ncbi:MAG: exonuclease domain-containing protein [Firmicutes bacterium]|nr:exonuclease domain-containing protein [Bacillota bacterium]MCL1954168.1 exonuclease domain-containing protein [Bacillota bacterium]
MQHNRQYLFFDIECSDGQHICSFGYVLTDCNLNIVDKQDIIINPEAKFKTGRAGFDPNINFAYPKADFLKAPTFDKVSGRIFDIMQTTNPILIGHSVDNDFKFLIQACKRYGLEMPDFVFFDTQMLYKTIHVTGQIALDKLATALNVDCTATLHKSDDDALLTKEIFGKICAEQGLSPMQLLEQYKYTQGKSIGNTVYVYENNPKTMFRSQISHYRPSIAIVGHQLQDKSFCISPKLLDTYLYELWIIVERMIDCGAVFMDEMLGDFDIFVWDNNSQCKTCDWINKNDALAHVQILNLKQICNILGLDFGNLPMPERQNYRVAYCENIQSLPTKKERNHYKPMTNTIGDILKARGMKL